jgi:hypothetical protein
VNGDSLHTFKQQVFLNICEYCSISADAQSLVITDGLLLTVDLVLVVTEDDYGWWRLLKTFEKVKHLCFLLDVFNLLNDLSTHRNLSADADPEAILILGLHPSWLLLLVQR